MASPSSVPAFVISTAPCACCLAALALGRGPAADAAVIAAYTTTRRRYAGLGDDAQAPLLLATLLGTLARTRVRCALPDADAPIALEVVPDIDTTVDWTQAPQADRIVFEALLLLRAPERAAYLLRHLQGWPVATAAQVIGVSARALQRIERRARHALHAMLALKGANREDGFVSLDAAVASVLLRAFAPDAARVVAQWVPSPAVAPGWRRLQAALLLRRSALRCGVLALASLAAVAWLQPSWPGDSARGQPSDAALLASEWPLDVLIHPLPQGAQDD